MKYDDSIIFHSDKHFEHFYLASKLYIWKMFREITGEPGQGRKERAILLLHPPLLRFLLARFASTMEIKTLLAGQSISYK